MMRVVTFKIDEELLEKIDMLARAQKKSRSEIIRKALERYLLEERNRATIRPARLRVFA